MNVKKIGSDKIPAVGLGTWGIGGYLTPDYRFDDKSIKALKIGINVGLKLIDTAEIYGRGHAEEIVGKAINHFPREEIFIVTKVSPSNAISEEKLVKSLKMSLRRLNVKYIDLYLIHWYEPYIRLKTVMKIFEKLTDEGFVRYIGVSNFSLRLLEKARYYLSKYDIVANQVKYNLMDRSIEKSLLPYCSKENITIMAYSPLESGKLARDDTLHRIGKKYSKSAAQVALNWVISHPNVIAITKSNNKNHIIENAGAMGWSLSREDIIFLEKYNHI